VANGAPRPRGPQDPQLQAAMEEAAVREFANAQLAARINGALTDPISSRRAYLSKCDVIDENGIPVLLVGMPNGERWEIPMSQVGSQDVARKITEHWEQQAPRHSDLAVVR
jgi:hypothetical protein